MLVLMSGIARLNERLGKLFVTAGTVTGDKGIKTCASIKFAASLQTKSAKSKHDVNVIRRMPGRFLTFAVLKKKSTLL